MIPVRAFLATFLPAAICCLPGADAQLPPGAATRSIAAAPSFSYVQQAVSRAFSGTVLTATLSGVGAGHNLRVAILMNPATASIELGGGIPCAVITNSGSSASAQLEIASCPNAPAGDVTVTATTSTPIADAALYIEEWAGDAAKNPADGGAAAYTKSNATGDTLSAGSFTTKAAGDSIWCVLFQQQNVTPTAGPAFTIQTTGGDAGNIFTEYSIQPAAGAIEPGWIGGAASYDNYVGAAAFK
jgi:hypothetical protein